MNLLLIFFIGFVSFYGIICLCVYLVQTNLMFFPSKEVRPLPSLKNLTEVSFRTSDNIVLNGWFLDNTSKKTVLFLHGNGGNVSYNEERLSIFTELWVNALMVDYRSYGKSEGEIREESDFYRDADAGYEFLIQKGILPENIIIWGQSLWGAMAIHISQGKKVFATIIESTFRSMDAMASSRYSFLPTSMLLKYRFQSDKKIGNIVSPVLIIHSKNDEMIDISHGKYLFEQANTPKTFLEIQGSHNGGFWQSYPLYVAKLQDILAGHKGG